MTLPRTSSSSHFSNRPDFRFTVNPIKMSTEKDHLTDYLMSANALAHSERDLFV